MFQVFLTAACVSKERQGRWTVVPISLPDGTRLSAEVARTPEEQARGLMFRIHLPEDHAMLFVFEEDGVQTFWMKNTWVDLDIVFLGPDHRIREIFEAVPRTSAATPQEEIPRVQARGAYVLEMPAGTSQRYRLVVGDVLTFDLPP
jgi:uncharacterized membrane protein (UPF0127 family)